MNKKHDLDFKLKLIKEYKEGNIGYDSLSNKYDIDPSQLKRFCCKVEFIV